MRALRRNLTYANVTSTVAIVLVVGGGAAYAADTIGSSDIIDESILSQDIKNSEVKTADIANNQVLPTDVRDDDLSNGGLEAADLAPGSVGTSEVDGSLTGGDIADTNTLGDPDIDQDSLGLVAAEGEPGCCAVRLELLATDTAFSAGNPSTFVDLGSMELRSTATAAPDKFVICNTGGVPKAVIVYRGGPVNSAAASRDDFGIAAGACSGSVDYNGGTTTSQGDFRILTSSDGTVVDGFSTQAGLDPVVVATQTP